MKDFLDLAFDMLTDDTFFDVASDENKKLVNTFITTPLAFNLKKDKDNNCLFELGMAGVKKENVKISRKGRTFTIICLAVENTDDFVYYKKGLKVPTDKDIVSTFVVPEIFDVTKAEFAYEDGRLTIKVPLSEKEQPIDINL